MILKSEFINGCFGDPALYVSELNGKQALLFDCGDITRFSVKQLLKVNHIFLSHCHIDHFFGFDSFIRAHVASETTTTIYGPPDTSRRVEGKLQGYTWNLIGDQNLEFIVVDLDAATGQKKTTHLHAKNRFLPSDPVTQDWKPTDPVFATDTYAVHTAALDHRTPSMAYTVAEKPSFGVNTDAVAKMKLVLGSWINDLKKALLAGETSKEILAVTTDGKQKSLKASDLEKAILTPNPTNKIAYITDGATHEENRKKLLKLLRDTDLLYSETCFLHEDEALAIETKHFTAQFIGRLAQEAGVKKLLPFHFSKRYNGRADQVFKELSENFKGEIDNLDSTLIKS